MKRNLAIWTRGSMVAVLLWLMAPAVAHHGWAAFNPDRTVSFEGTVTAFRFLNPHSVVEFNITNASGATEKWQGELTSSPRLASKGWTAATLGRGDMISIEGHPARSGVNVIRITRISLAGGKELPILMDN